MKTILYLNKNLTRIKRDKKGENNKKISNSSVFNVLMKNSDQHCSFSESSHVPSNND